jgi:hypothetical protein
MSVWGVWEPQSSDGARNDGRLQKDHEELAQQDSLHGEEKNRKPAPRAPAAVSSSSTHYTRNGGSVGSVTKSLDVVGSSFCRKIESNNPFYQVARNPSTRELW